MNEELLRLLQGGGAPADASNVNIPTPQGDFSKNQPNGSANLANGVGSINDPEYVEAGVSPWIADMRMGGASKGGKGIMAILKNLLGKAKSHKKFPTGYGFPSSLTNVSKPHSNIDNLIAKAELSKIPKKPQISSYLKDSMAKHRFPADPNKSKMILRNDPKKLRR